jgi:hypothetical protein
MFCSKSLDVPAVIGGLLSLRKTLGDKVAINTPRGSLVQHHAGCPGPGEGPEFIFYAASLQTGDGVRICKRFIADYKVGMIPNPQLSLAKVVGASSAFPPIFSPVIIRCNPDDWQELEGAYLYKNINTGKSWCSLTAVFMTTWGLKPSGTMALKPFSCAMPVLPGRIYPDHAATFSASSTAFLRLLGHRVAD